MSGQINSAVEGESILLELLIFNLSGKGGLFWQHKLVSKGESSEEEVKDPDSKYKLGTLLNWMHYHLKQDVPQLFFPHPLYVKSLFLKKKHCVF